MVAIRALAGRCLAMASCRSSICVTPRSSGTAISPSSTISRACPAHAEARFIRTAPLSSTAANCAFPAAPFAVSSWCRGRLRKRLAQSKPHHRELLLLGDDESLRDPPRLFVVSLAQLRPRRVDRTLAPRPEGAGGRQCRRDDKDAGRHGDQPVWRPGFLRAGFSDLGKNLPERPI